MSPNESNTAYSPYDRAFQQEIEQNEQKYEKKQRYCSVFEQNQRKKRLESLKIRENQAKNSSREARKCAL